MSIGGELDTVLEAAGEVLDEGGRGGQVALCDEPTWNELGIRTDRSPCPNIAIAKFAPLIFRDVLLFDVAE